MRQDLQVPDGCACVVDSIEGAFCAFGRDGATYELLAGADELDCEQCVDPFARFQVASVDSLHDFISEEYFLVALDACFLRHHQRSLILDIALNDEPGFNLALDALDVVWIQFCFELLVALNILQVLFAFVRDLVLAAALEEFVFHEFVSLGKCLFKDLGSDLLQRDLLLNILLILRHSRLNFLGSDDLDPLLNELFNAIVENDGVQLAELHLLLLIFIDCCST